MGKGLPGHGTRIRAILANSDASASHYRKCQSRYFSIRYTFYAPSINIVLRITKTDEEAEKVEDRDGWETISMDGRTVGIRTSAIEEKCQAYETLVIYCSTLGPRFAPYLAQCLELTLPSLTFYFHDGVREACSMYVNLFHVEPRNPIPPI